MTIPPSLASALSCTGTLVYPENRRACAALTQPRTLPPGQTAHPASTTVNSSPATQKLRKAAAEFESLLVSNLLKSMKSTFTDSEDDQSTDPAHDTLEDFGTRAMATAIANAGGLGIGSLILKHLEPAIVHSQNGNQLPDRKDSGPPADILIEHRQRTSAD
jgi:Rod binding domain-containing protein